MNYKVYRNLHNGKLSIKDAKTGLVVGHADEVSVFLAKFKVSKAGVQRIRRLKQKAVVATVNGGIPWMKGFVSYKGRDVTLCYNHLVGGQKTLVTFNPYKYESFVNREDESPVAKAELVVIKSSGLMEAYAVNDSTSF